MAARIGDDSSVWGNVWLILLAVMVVLMVVGGPYHPARLLGDTFAPDFDEVFVREPPECDAFGSCEGGPYKREFRSSSGTWESILNGWLPWLVPPIVVIAFALATRPLVNRMAGYAVASVRYAGYRDTWVRALLVVVATQVPLIVLIVYWLAPPDPPKPPGA